MSDPPIVILLAVHDGARHLPAQLDSIARQDHRDWQLVISDDGSNDGSALICAAFAATRPSDQVRIIRGPGAGATANFLHLIEAAPDRAILAFCDQDDVWHRDKLSRAARALARHGAGAAHYSARTVIAGPDLAPLAASPRFGRPFGLRNALIQACTSGNTSVFNPAAATLLKAGAAAARQAGIVSHDWWAYQLVAAAGGTILKDDAAVLLYRQHGGNEMGRNDTMRARARRLSMLFDGRFGRWLAANHAALSGAADLLDADARATVARFGAALRLPGPAASRQFAALGLYRHDALGTAAFYAAAAAGRLRRHEP